MHVPTDLLPVVDYDLSFDGETGSYWNVSSVWVEETINRPLQAIIDAAIEVEFEADVDIDALLGSDARLVLSRGTYDPQHLFGLVARVDVLGFADQLLNIRFYLSSAFELLRQSTHSRIWQGAAPLNIVKEVLEAELGAYGRSFDASAVTRGVSPREYCVQYRESMFSFVSRLLEEEGISYCFTHDPDKGHELLTLVDANDQYRPIASVAGSDTLPFVPDQAEFIELESVQALDRTRSLTSTAVLRRDFDWREPESLHTATVDGTDGRGRTRRLYAHTQRRFVSKDLDERGRDLQVAAALRAAGCDGSSNALVIRAGVRFKLSGHPNDALDQEYIVTSVRHSGHPGSANQYVNDFDCVLTSVEVRPQQVTPKPRTQGPQTAIVTGDDEIHTDEYGRIQVQFSWEEEPSYAAGSSCWIRCVQSWAGSGWGTQFIPRVGMEVVVDFLEGNPDRPVVVGCVFDGSREHSFVVPDTKTQSGWRTRSSPDSEGFNELRFEDASGSEEIYVHAQRNLRTEVEADESRSIGGGRASSIVGDDQLTISEGDVTITVKKGKRTIEISEGDDAVTVKQGGASRSVPLGTDSLEAKEVVITAQDKLRLECGGSSIEITPALIEMKSAMIKLN